MKYGYFDRNNEQEQMYGSAQGLGVEQAANWSQ